MSVEYLLLQIFYDLA